MRRDYLAEMNNSGILMQPELTQEDFRVELLKFQDMLCGLIFKDGEYHRIEEAIVFLEKAARDNGVDKDPRFRKGMQAMRRINKEIAISMAGKRGEDRVARTLEYISRPNYKFRNVYLTDEERETELDNVILTEAGFIILEVKNVKTDITISETGRILYDNEECYHDVSICEKMQTKRELLQAALVKRLADKGHNIPIRIDSLIVLSAPKGVFINVTDRCRKEKYCFRGKLPFIIDAYAGEQLYSETELQELNSVMEEMATHQKCFMLNLDFNEIRSDIAEALEMAMPIEEPVAKRIFADKTSIVTNRIRVQEAGLKRRQNYRRAAAALIGSAASFAAVAGTLMTSLTYRKA